VEKSHLPGFVKILHHAGENATLVVMVEPHVYDGATLTQNDIPAIIKEHNAENWYLAQQQIDLLLAEQHNLKEAKGYTIAEQRDCRIEVHTDPDKMKAWVTIHPAAGGKQLDQPYLLSHLTEADVVCGIKEDVVAELVAASQCENVLIAEGTSPQLGEDARLEMLIKDSDQKGRPHERQDGTVDYYELGLFNSVQKGTPLLRKYPATPGIAGTGVDGSPIPAQGGKDIPISLGAGTGFSEEDPNLIVATIPGQPQYGRNAVKVIGKLELGEVNFETGNIDFDGSVMVRGPVNEGFKVKAGADLHISDTVEGAELTAGGNLELRGGVFGKKHGRLTAKGHIRARFLDSCVVQCEGDLEVEDLMANCQVSCGGTIHLGKKGGRGQAYGGKLSAIKGVTGKTLGSASEVETLVEISPSPAIMVRQQELEVEITRTEKSLENLERSLSYLRRNATASEPRVKSYVENCALTNQKLQELRSEFATLTERINAYAQGQIRVQQAFPGVTLQIGKRKKVITSFTKDILLNAAETPGKPG
jgi:uncharacterized protein